MLFVKDANGNEITDETDIASINPIRYRGYYYDTDTGLYYLKARYYDPVTHRFISADSYLGEVGAALSHNLFTYCENNPIFYHDPSGNFKIEARKGTLPYLFGLLFLGISMEAAGLEQDEIGNALSIAQKFEHLGMKISVFNISEKAAKTLSFVADVGYDLFYEYFTSGVIGVGVMLFTTNPLISVLASGAISYALERLLGEQLEMQKKRNIASGRYYYFNYILSNNDGSYPYNISLMFHENGGSYSDLFHYKRGFMM